MINPSPVHGKSSPYSQNAVGTRPTLPRSLAEPKPIGSGRWKRVFLVTLLTLVAAGSTYAFAEYHTLKANVIVDHQGENATAILSYDPQDKNSSLDPTQFKNVGDGRFNVLIVGVGGGTHPGAFLTDTMQVMSIDTINKKVSITSLPRDLFVKIPNYGQSKINAAYEAGESQKTNGGALIDRQVVGSVFGVKISNFALIDFTGAREAIDDLGGVDINVPTALYDPSFPCDDDINYCPFSISAGPHHMDGSTALKYARTRHVDSDFGRAARQQVVIQAAKSKALSAGILANPVKVNSLINDLGNHVKTDLQTSDISSLLSIYQASSQGASSVLDTSDEENLLTSTTDPVAGYISYPRKGYSDFSDIQRWFQKNNPDPLLAVEGAKVQVAAGNATVTAKQIQAEVDLLNDYGYTATASLSSPGKSYSATQLFDTTDDKKPITRNYLGSQFKTTVQDGSAFSSSDADFQLIYVPAAKK